MPGVARRDQLEPIETASRDELAAIALERMQWSVRHAYGNVAHYRKKCEEKGVRPDDLKTIEDLAKFPFTTKQDLRETYPFGHFAVPIERVARLHASSGTTGQPTVVGYTARDLENWTVVVARSIRAAGGRAGDRCQVAYGYGLFTGGLGAHYGAERLGCTVIPMGGGQTEKQIRLIQDLRPRIIMATPSYLMNIAEQMERAGFDPRSTSLQIGILGAEPWTERMRAAIESRLGIDALDIYGLSEVIGPGVASECIETKDGPVIWEDHFYPEIIDPATGAVRPDGAAGELVFTTLTKEAMPVIRYRTRDLTRLLPPTARSMRRMGKITGRSDDMLIIRGVNVFPTQIEEIVLTMPELAACYQIVVSRDGAMDEMDVHVEMRAHAMTDDPAILGAMTQELQREIKTHVGITTRVRVLAPNGIERGAGKAVRVIDRRKG